jgi:hypothetical protein
MQWGGCFVKFLDLRTLKFRGMIVAWRRSDVQMTRFHGTDFMGNYRKFSEHFLRLLKLVFTLKQKEADE